MVDEGTDASHATRGRSDTVPNANSPQLLTHLLEMVARGIRSTRGLQEALGVDQRTVRYYIQAGVWLGLLLDDGDPLLSPDGLGYVYAGPARTELYARAVAQQPFVVDLLQRTGGRLPDTDAIERAILRADPQLAPATVSRRASSVRGLIGPFLEHRTREPAAPDAHEQLLLPLSQAPHVEPAPPLTRISGRSFSPDIYRYLLCFLLDHGELTLGHVRGLLDRAGAGDVPIGSYVDLALERGDAVRVDERLVVTPGAVARRDAAASTAAVILTDGGWRLHLDDILEALDDQTQPVVRAPGRYRLWNRRLLGKDLDAATLRADLHAVLRDRSLDAWLRTGPDAAEPAIVHEAFVDCWQTPGLIVALPPSLVQLWEGIAGVNRHLRNARHRADAVGTPSTAYRPSVVHGGLLHPGEPLPRSIPDMRTLRLRIVAHSPYVTMLVALLSLQRAGDPVVDVRHREGVWEVVRHRKRLGALLDVLDGFARSQRWLPARRHHGSISSRVLVGLAERLGLAVATGDRLMLDDTFFGQLRSEEDEGVLRTGLDPLGQALAGWIGELANATGATP